MRPTDVGRRDAQAPLALAIDIGTSSTRVAAFDALARPVAGTLTRSSHEVRTDRHGAATLDADALVEGVAACVDGTLARLGRRAEDVAVVATSAFWHSLLGVDARGRAATPLFTWADMRARDAARALRSELDADAFHERTGCYLHATYPAVKLRWLRDARAASYGRVARWVSLAEYLGLRVAGEASASHSMASATGLYDHATHAWDPATLAAVGVDGAALPRIDDAPVVGLRRAFARRWPRLARVPWLPGIGDGAAANVGSGCATRDAAAISFGTSGAVRTCYPASRAAARGGLWEYRLDERYVVTGGAVNNGWNAVRWTARTWRGAHEERDSGLTVLPLFAGERTPWWDDAASAAIAGIRLSTTPDEIGSAVVEAVVLRLAAAAKALVDAHPAIQRLFASGGTFAWRPDLAQIVADVLGRPVALSRDAEASARGAAIVALAHVGALASIELPPATTRTYRPRRAPGERYRALLERQARLHDALRSARL